MFFKLYEELNCWKISSPWAWPVWLYELFGQELFHVRIFLDLKLYETGDANLRKKNSVQQTDMSLYSIWILQFFISCILRESGSGID